MTQSKCGWGSQDEMSFRVSLEAKMTSASRLLGFDFGFGVLEYTHRLLSSSFLGLPYRIRNMNHKKELLRSLWVGL